MAKKKAKKKRRARPGRKAAHKHKAREPRAGRPKLPPTNVQPDPLAKFPVLISYAYLRKSSEEELAWILGNPHVEFLIDSGGFSALNMGEEIPLQEYIEWLQRWKEKLFGYVHLDKLGDPVTSERNLEVMLEAGLKPVPVHVRGDDQARMDYLFTLSDWVALGGFRRPQMGWGPKEYVREKMAWANGRNVHWLGYTRADMVLGFKPYSCDSSNGAAGRIWGQCQIYRGLGRMESGRYHDWRARVFDLQLRRQLERAGFTRDDFLNPALWRMTKDIGTGRCIPNEVSTASWVYYTRDLRTQTGVRYFQATTPSFTGRLYYWIDKTLPEGEQPYLVDGQHPEWAK